MPELSYSTGYQIPGTTYAVPNWSNYTYSAPSFTIPTIPSFTFPTLPSLQTTPQLYELLGINTAPEYYIPTTTAYDKYDPTLVTIRTNALQLRNNLELAIFDLTYAIDEINISRNEANQVITSLSNISTDLKAKASQLTTSKQQLDTAKAQLDSNVSLYRSSVNSLAADAARFDTARQALEGLKAQYNTALDKYNSDAATLNAANTRLTQDQAALTAAQQSYNTARTQYEAAKAALGAAEAQLAADGNRATAGREELNRLTREYDAARTALDRAYADLDQRQAQLLTSEDDYNLSLQNLNAQSADLARQADQALLLQIQLNDLRRAYDLDYAEFQTNQQTLLGQEATLNQQEALLSEQQAAYDLAKTEYDIQAAQLQQDQVELGTDQRTIQDGEAELAADEQALADKREYLLQSSAELEQQQALYDQELAKLVTDRNLLLQESQSLELLKANVGSQVADLTGILGSNAALQQELSQVASELQTRQQEYLTKSKELEAAFAQYDIDKSKLDQILAAGGADGGSPELSASQQAVQAQLQGSASDVDRLTQETKASGLNVGNLMNMLIAMLKAGLLGLQSWLNFLKVTGQGGGGSTRPAPGGGSTRVIVDPGTNYAGLFPYMRRENSNLSYGLGLVVLILMAAWAIDGAVNKGQVTRRVRVTSKKALRRVRR